MLHYSVLLLLLSVASGQQIGHQQPDSHPSLTWTKCQSPEACNSVAGKIVLDAEWRWLHRVDSFFNCFDGQRWADQGCNSVANCTEKCALEGADLWGTNGVKVTKDSVSQTFVTKHQFGEAVNNRVFLLESDTKYQTFTLMDNEFAFDVDLSAVECGIAGSLYFVAMEADGGKSRFPTNKAGAAYGTGYCDASCTRSNKFVGGKANYDDWIPNQYSKTTGSGSLGACCSEFAVWNSNAHSFTTSSRPCKTDEYKVCKGDGCDPSPSPYPIVPLHCDRVGCDYNPYRLGITDFYGKGKKLDTTKKFTVVTQFQKSGVSQFFIQDGKKIEAPAPAFPELSGSSGLTEEYCDIKPSLFEEPNIFAEVGGWDRQIEMLQKPMVLAMSINDDYEWWNLWLDSAWPVDADPAAPGVKRGECLNEDREPSITEGVWGNAKVVWSNIRFGPVGSTVLV